MYKLWMTLLIPCIAVFGSGTVNAQEPGKLAAVVGASNSNLTGYGTAGALWQISNRFAVRGDFSATHSDTVSYISYSNTTSHQTSKAIAVGASGLITLHQQDNLRVYVSPRYARAFNNFKFLTLPFPSSSTTTWKPYSSSLSLGGQYNFSRRFGVFGESGMENVRYRTVQQGLPDENTSVWQSISTFGILLYF